MNSRTLNATLKKEPSIKASSTSSSTSSIEDDVLQNVKFKTETLNKMQAKKQELTESPKTFSSDVRRNSASQPAGLTHLIGNSISKDSLTAQVVHYTGTKNLRF